MAIVDVADGKVGEPNVEYIVDKDSEETRRGKGLTSELQKKYGGKEISYFSLSMSDDKLLKALGVPEEERDAELANDTRKYFSETKDLLGGYDPRTRKIYIFAERLTPRNAERIFFHENIHGILHDIYGDRARKVAEHFWDIATEDGKTKKSFVEKKYEKEKHEEELLTYWLHKSMQDGTVDDMLSMFEDEADRKIIEQILTTLHYDKARESEERRAKEEPLQRISGEEQDRGILRRGGVEEASTPLFREDGEEDSYDRAIARDAYERMVASGASQFREATQDSMMSLKNLYKSIIEAEGNKARLWATKTLDVSSGR